MICLCVTGNISSYIFRNYMYYEVVIYFEIIYIMKIIILNSLHLYIYDIIYMRVIIVIN